MEDAALAPLVLRSHGFTGFNKLDLFRISLPVSRSFSTFVRERAINCVDTILVCATVLI